MHHLQRRIQDFVKGEASRDAEGIQGETPKASRGVRVGRVSRFHTGAGLRRELCPLPRQFWNFIP